MDELGREKALRYREGCAVESERGNGKWELRGAVTGLPREKICSHGHELAL